MGWPFRHRAAAAFRAHHIANPGGGNFEALGGVGDGGLPALHQFGGRHAVFRIEDRRRRGGINDRDVHRRGMAQRRHFGGAVLQQESDGAQHQAGGKQFAEIQRSGNFFFECARWRHQGSLVSVSENFRRGGVPITGTVAPFARCGVLNGFDAMRCKTEQ